MASNLDLVLNGPRSDELTGRRRSAAGVNGLAISSLCSFTFWFNVSSMNDGPSMLMEKLQNDKARQCGADLQNKTIKLKKAKLRPSSSGILVLFGEELV